MSEPYEVVLRIRTRKPELVALKYAPRGKTAMTNGSSILLDEVTIEVVAPEPRRPPKFYSGMKCTVCGNGKLRRKDSRRLASGSDLQRVKLVCNACGFVFGRFEVPRDECDLGKGRRKQLPECD